MKPAFTINCLITSAIVCAALLTAGCTQKDSPVVQTSQTKRITNGVPPKRMTNNVPLALDNELQNRNDGKWYWRGTTNLFTGIEILPVSYTHLRAHET